MVARTYHPKPSDIDHAWILVDASGQTLGRLASRISGILLGKGKAQYTPGADVGDYVVVVNAEKIAVTGKKLDEKLYTRHSQYPGGLRQITLRDQLARHPNRVIEAAVWGMLPHNRLGRKLIKKLKVYAGPDHPHAAQKPKVIS